MIYKNTNLSEITRWLGEFNCVSLYFIKFSESESLVCPLHDEDAGFVKQEHRGGYQHQGNGIRSRSDDGGDNQSDDDGVFAVGAHEGGSEETQLGKEPRQDGNLERDA